MTLEALFAQAAKHAAFDAQTPDDAQTPENGMPAQAVIENLVARSVPGLRAMTGQGASGGRVRRWGLLGDRRTQVVADAIRMRLCDRARCRSAPRRDDNRRELSAAGRRWRARSFALRARTVAARGFATWAMIRHLGRDGIAAMVAEHCRLAAHMATLPAREPGQVIVRFGARDADEAADRMMLETIRRTQADGTRFAGGPLWCGRWMTGCR